MQLGMTYLKTCSGTQLNVAILTLESLACLFVLGGTYPAPNSRTLHQPVSVVSCVKSFYLACGWSLSSLSYGQNAKLGTVFIGVGWFCSL